MSMSGPPVAASRRRYAVLGAAVAMQLCLGATYSWSVFVEPLRRVSGISQGAAQLPFTLFYVAFPATMFFSGRIIAALGARGAAVLGGILFGGGWILAGLLGQGIMPLVVGVGLVGGIGVGCAYGVPIATCIKWFPRKPGLVTGMAVAGFGGGAALVTQAATWLLARGATGPYATLTLLGGVFLVLVSLAGLLMTEPEAVATVPRGSSWTAPAGAFPWLYVCMVAGLAAGFTVNANMRELADLPQARAGAWAVSLFALANAAGRIGWGWWSDRCEGTVPLQANLVLQAVALLILAAVPVTLWVYLLLAVFTGMNYGGVLVLYAARVSRYYGPQRLAEVYGRLFTANIVAAGAPVAAGLAYDGTGNFRGALLALVVVLVGAGWLARSKLPPGRPVAPPP